MIYPKEFQSRVHKVTMQMANLGLNALVVFDDESILRGGNVRYLTNFFNPIPPRVSAVIISPGGVTLSVDPGLSNTAFRLSKQDSWVEDVIGSRNGVGEHDLAQEIATTLHKANIHNGKIGVDGLHLVTEPVAKSIRAALSDFELVEKTGIVDRLRMVKSPSEFEIIDEALRLADVGVTAFTKAVKAGAPLYLSVMEAESAAMAQGAQSLPMFMGAGTPFIWGTNHGRQVYKEGDMVAIEANARFQGYYGQVCRSFVIGKASAKQRQVLDATMEAYQKAASMLKPGVRASEIFVAVNKEIKKAGCEPVPMRQGHGMGLTIAESFNIYEGDETEMEAGFYVMIHPIVVFEEGHVILGNCFRVTETGSEDLGKAEFCYEVRQ